MGAAAEIPVGPLTPREIQKILDELPARDRAALDWACSGVRQAIDLLHGQPLSEEVIQRAARKYAAALPPILALEARMATEEPAAHRRAIQERWQDLDPRVSKYLGATEHAQRLARTLQAMFFIGTLAMEERILEQTLEVDVSSREGAGLRASVLVAAVLDAAEEGIPVERAHALIERADLESWVMATLLAENPGGPISVPGYDVEAKAPPPFKTELARRLWEHRQRVIEDAGGTLSDEEVEAEVAARRGGVGSGC